jgi:hypothetical protein
MKDAGLVAASANAQVAAVDKILDLGLGRVDFRVVVDVTACEVDTGNEKYQVMLELSNSSSFASGIFVAGVLVFGHSSTTLESASTATPRRQELAACNEINGVLYRYARLYTQVVGTIATGINYAAFLGMEA